MTTAVATDRRRHTRTRKAALASRQVCVLVLSDSPAVACKPVRFDNGEPVYWFRKQVIRCGSFTTSEGQPFEVTPITLRTWLDDFHRMQKNKVAVPIPTRHDDTSADGNRGYVVDMALSNDGRGIDATMELIGNDSPKLAASNHVSIYAEPDWMDGNGNRYQWPIRHVALTPDPRITGLKGFIPLAASNKKSFHVPFYRMNKIMAKRRIQLDSEGNPMNVPGTGYGESPANDGTGSAENDPLDMILDAIEEESLPKIREAKDKTERVALAKEMARKIDAALAIFEKEIEDEGEEEEDEGKEKPDAQLSNESKWCSIEKNMERKQRKQAAMSNTAIHPELIRLSNQNRQMQIEQLFRDRKITAHQRKELLAKFTGDAPVKLALSNTAAAQTFEQTLTILASNQPYRGMEASGVQTLSDPLKLSNQKDDPETSAALQYMHEQVGMKTASAS